jgi:prophage regulatory protein
MHFHAKRAKFCGSQRQPQTQVDAGVYESGTLRNSIAVVSSELRKVHVMRHTPPQSTVALLRVSQIVGDPKANPPIPALVPIGRSSWWQKVKSGEAPAPVKIGKRVTAWRASDIERYIESLQGGNTDAAPEK